MDDDVQLRTMQRDEVALAIEWATHEGWNPGLHDAACFHAADADGFLLATCGGEPVGCISAVSYGGRFGFIGLYIVRPAWRGRGIGWRLWQRGMARLAGAPVGLDGVPAQQANYRRSGFELAWRNLRHGGPARHDGMDAPGIVPLGRIDFAQVLADDLRVFPAPREAFLRAWITMPDATALALQADGALAGWGVVRRCRAGHKIGPLVAHSAAAAQDVFDALCRRVPAGELVYLDVPQPNARALALAERAGLQPVFETARMYAGAAPVLELDRLYGITSFELG